MKNLLTNLTVFAFTVESKSEVFYASSGYHYQKTG